MKISIATLVVSAMLVCTANAAPPAPPHTTKHRVVTCDQARPGTKLWKQCHRKKAPKIVKQPRAPNKPAPGDRNLPPEQEQPPRP